MYSKICVLLTILLALAISAAGQSPLTFTETKPYQWPEEYVTVKIKSTLDQTEQPAKFRKTTDKTNRPLIVSLHSWSGDYTEKDPLLDQVTANNYNYLRPNLRGPNNNAQACASQYVITDLADAIQYAIKKAKVDENEIHITGLGGGGYTSLAALLLLPDHIKIKSVSAWGPITDLVAWLEQSIARKNKYASMILRCCGNEEIGLDKNEIKNRSPLLIHSSTDRLKNTEVFIQAGAKDGYKGAVPPTHSIYLYNKLVNDITNSNPPPGTLVTDTEIIKILTVPNAISPTAKKISDRNIVLERNFKNLHLVIFDGGEEMLVDVALTQLPIGQAKK